MCRLNALYIDEIDKGTVDAVREKTGFQRLDLRPEVCGMVGARKTGGVDPGLDFA